jgi:(p)ppGpp synthase/HD superfamily hydrolase
MSKSKVSKAHEDKRRCMRGLMHDVKEIKQCAWERVKKKWGAHVKEEGS